ncbi:MAG: sulfotransferase [Leptolyngbya sp. SIO1E4]|nr:sulfotransferase [Leptolyngbya sp. SIO1E4]
MTEGEISKGQPIVIAGMHRSGTSLTASILQKSGVDIGEKLLGSGTGNSKGHFEDVDFLSLHQEFLVSQGVSSEGWTSLSKVIVSEQLTAKAKSLLGERSQKPTLWGWKDPRTVLFLDFWHELIPNAKFVFVYRVPWEVVDSLFKRGDPAFINNPKLAVQVWSAYNTAVLDFYTRNPDCSVLLNVENLQRPGNELISVVVKKLGIPLNPLGEDVYLPGEMHDEVSKTHRPALLSRYFPDALELYQKLESVADLPAYEKPFRQRNASAEETYEDWVFQDWLMSQRHLAAKRRVQVELQQTQGELQQTQGALQQTQGELQQTQAELQRTQSELQQMQAALQQTQGSLQQTQAALRQAEETVMSMESSKFWKARQLWMRIKSAIGLNYA